MHHEAAVLVYTYRWGTVWMSRDGALSSPAEHQFRRRDMFHKVLELLQHVCYAGVPLLYLHDIMHMSINMFVRVLW